jgi:hypothetical protein
MSAVADPEKDGSNDTAKRKQLTVNPHLTTSQQLKVHVTHTKHC